MNICEGIILKYFLAIFKNKKSCCRQIFRSIAFTSKYVCIVSNLPFFLYLFLSFTIQKGKIQNESHRVYHKLWRKQNR